VKFSFKPKWALNRLRVKKPVVVFLPLIILFNVFVGIYVIANLVDWKIPYLNPPDEAFTITMPFWYPDIPVGGDIYLDREIYGVILLTYCGVLVEGRQVQLKAEATASREFAQNITRIVIMFQGANIVPMKGVAPTVLEEYFQGAVLLRTNGLPKNLAIYMDTTFEGERTLTWLTEGYYYPTLTIHYNDKSTIEEPLEEYTIHVNSSYALRQEEYHRVNKVLSITLFGFSMIGFLEIITKIRKWAKDTSHQFGWFE